MREIITIQAGQCGNQIGERFWEAISCEHGLLLNSERSCQHRRDQSDTYFAESPDGFFSRTILTDGEFGALDSIRARPFSGLFRTENFVVGPFGSAQTWARGYYTEGAELVDSILDVVQHEVEACDCLQGFHLTHSLGGGIGGGTGTLILSRLKEEYPDRSVLTFSVIPSPEVSDTVVEPYNAVLSLSALLQDTDGCVCIDNEALYNRCVRRNRQNGTFQPVTYGDLNSLSAAVMTGVTTSLRFSGLPNSRLRSMAMNLAPFPRLHFFMVSTAPFGLVGHSVDDVCQQLFQANSFTCAADPRHGRYLSAVATIRGRVPNRAVPQLCTNPSKHSPFVEWIPDNLKVSHLNVAPLKGEVSATLLANSTAIESVFRRLCEQFSLMFSRKAFLHWFLGEGMDEIEFVDAEASVLDLLVEYQQYSDMASDWAAHDYEEE